MNSLVLKNESTIEEELLYIKWEHEELCTKATWNVPNIVSPYRLTYQKLQSFIMNRDLNIDQFQSLVNTLNARVLEQNFGQQYELKMRNLVFDANAEDFKTIFKMFIKAYKENKVIIYECCKDCGNSYVIENRQWFIDKGLQMPKRCEPCLQIKRSKKIV
jgi:hypothetical protein